MSPSASAGWLWRLLVLALATSRPIRAIQVAPDDGARSPGNSTDQQPTDNTTLVGDSHLSASERNRRLIPYMAFYLPAPEFPENQQYAVQRPKQQQQQQHADSAGPLPPPGAIPIPTAYVHMKVPAAATGNDVHFQQHQLLQQQRQPFPPSAGEVYHSISYGGQHPVPAGPKEGAKKTPVLHLLAPGASGPSAPSGPPPSAPASGNKHNAVLVYQPSGAGQLQQPPQKQRQPQPFRQRTKPSKSRLTPFTAANTVPGHFIPIIYTSLAPTNDGDNTSGPGPSNAIHYNGEEASADEQQQPQPQQPDYALPPSAPTSPGQSSHPGQHQVQFLAVTAGPSPAPAARPTSSAPQYIDYVIDEPRQSLDEEQQHRQQLQQAHQQHQPLATPQPTHAPPQAAFIVITTASPHPPDPPARTHFGSTPSPLYKNQPTVRLRPIAHYTTPSPNYPTRLSAAVHPTHSPDHQPSASPQYVYQTQASYSPTPTSKPKPAYDYEEHFAKPSKRPPPPSPTPAPTAAPTHVEPYRPPVEVQVQIQPASHYPQTQPQPRPQHPQPQPQPQPLPAEADPNQLPDIRSSSLADILHKLQASNHLPQTLTPDNIDNSIKTLITILNNLKQSQTIVANPPQHHETPHPGAAPDYDYTNGSEEDHRQDDLAVLSPIAPTKRPGPNTGRPGVDYPNYAEIPETSFNCGEQRYKGFFGDPETNCQVWHYCDLNGGKASFLCPNGTIFSQIALTCDWWFNVKCSTTSQLYVLNERLYKYILPFTPKFPEDYSGPIVDKYLALKFQEMEEKMRLEKHKTMEQPANTGQEPKTEEVDVTTVTQTAEIHSVNSQVGEQSSERNLLIDDEVNDISQRGSVDPYGSTTPSTPTTSLAAEMPLSLKPIVVSSTAEPNYEKSSEEQSYQGHTTQDIPTPYADQSNAPYSMQHQMPATREATKISVEKVEVIEIKTDGTSGHLTPEMIFNNEAKKR